MTNETSIPSKQLVDTVVSALEDKKGVDIVYIDFTAAPNTIANYFVICHGTSSVHADSLADGVLERVKKETGENPWNKEGMENAEWILLDYADVVVHIFQQNTRRFYNLEGLWADMATTGVKTT